MGIENLLIEGVSGTGKTTVCDEILRKAEPVHETCHFSVARRDNPK